MAIVMSEVMAALELAGTPGLDTLQLIEARVLAAQYYPLFDPSSPTLVLNLEGANPGRIQTVLLQAYAGTHEVKLVAEGARACAWKSWQRKLKALPCSCRRCRIPALTRRCRTFRHGSTHPTAAHGTRVDLGQAAPLPARGDVRAARRAGQGRPAEGARGRGRPAAANLAAGRVTRRRTGTTVSRTSSGASWTS